VRIIDSPHSRHGAVESMDICPTGGRQRADCAKFNWVIKCCCVQQWQNDEFQGSEYVLNTSLQSTVLLLLKLSILLQVRVL